jgi:hypothetical protein
MGLLQNKSDWSTLARAERLLIGNKPESGVSGAEIGKPKEAFMMELF